MPISDVTTLSLTMRPKSFDEVIGLEEVVRTMKAKLDAGGVPRAILLKGPYGCGKTTLALIISRYIQGPLFEGQPDIEEVNAANFRKIDDMRTLVQGCNSYPMRGTYKVILMDECHKLTKDSKEVLLKELEVPKSPTVWLLATTDPESLNEGIRSRCMVLEVKGMNAQERYQLVTKAALELGHTEDIVPFLNEITKQKIVSPRKILQAFELYHFGTPLAQAVGMQCVADMPEYHDIAFATLFGKWDEPVSMFGGTVTVKPLGQLLKELDERLKKKPAPDSDTHENENDIESEDLDSKTEVAAALKAVVGAFLKGQLLPAIQKNGFKYKNAAQSERAARGLNALAGFINPACFELQWSGIIATLYKVNSIMQEKKG
jgi:hypothetical protein